MAQHIEGPLYYERMGRSGRPVVLVHPNPMDQSSWIYQMAHLSTWFRCISIDIPGYGKSPRAQPGLTMDDMAQACWEALDEAMPGAEPAILAGCSVGSLLVLRMWALRPERAAALVTCGTGYWEPGTFGVAAKRIKDYRRNGIGFRFEYTFQDFGPAFRATPMAHYFAELFTERNDFADLQSILRQFEAMEPPLENDLAQIRCPSLILSGSEDASHSLAFALQERIPGCELRVIPGAGHACQIEQPWLFDRYLLEFLQRHGLHAGKPQR